MDAISRCRVVTSYEKKDANELNLKAGDVVEVIRKGKSIWYGRTANGTGFFPCNVVEDITENGSVTANGKAGATEPTSPTAKEFAEIPTTEVLDDAHRSRPKSPARPPSQVFIKSFILAGEAIDVDRDDESEESRGPKTEPPKLPPRQLNHAEEPPKLPPRQLNHAEEPPKPLPRLRNHNLVMELKQKSSFKSAPQPPVKEPVTPGEEVPSWARNLTPKKKASLPAPPEESRDRGDSTPLWMQEIRKRREHKLSLRGDDQDTAKVTSDIKSVIHDVRIAHGVAKEQKITTEVKGKTENHVDTKSQTKEEDKKGIDIPIKKEVNEVFSSPPSRTYFVEGVSTKKLSSSTSFSFTSRSVVEEKGNGVLVKKDANETSSSSRRSLVEEKKTVDTPTKTETTSFRKVTAEEKTGTDIPIKTETTAFRKVTTEDKKDIDIPIKTETISFRKVTAGDKKGIDIPVKKETSDTPPSSPMKIKDVRIESKTELSANSKPISEAKNAESKEQKENTKAETGARNGADTDIANALLKSVEGFEAAHKARATEMLVNVKKLEDMIHRQFQQDQQIIEEIKAKLSDLIKPKN